MNSGISRLFSLLFNPFIITTYYLLFLFSQPLYFAVSISDKAKWMVLGLVFVVTFLLPIILTWIFETVATKATRFDREDKRTMLLLTGSVFYFLCYYLLSSLKFLHVFNLFLLGFSLLIMVVLIINFYWKISAYMVACGSLAGALAGFGVSYGIDLLTQIISILLISGITGYSRLKQQAHSPAQVYTGFALGALAMTVLFLLY